ncbi:MAG: glycosyltransferase [Anaeromyxobacter sp.]|nr:glycosyltransferase [Anaeromyxobacter sp.]
MVTSVYKPATAYGGPVESIHQLTAALVREGATVTVLTTDADGARRVSQASGPMDGVQVHRYATTPLNSYGISPGLWSAVWRETKHHDLVHCQGLFLASSSVGMWAGLLRGRPLVVSPRGSLMAWGLRRRTVAKKAYLRLIDGVPLSRASVHVSSEEERADAVALGMHRVYVVPNGVDVAEWTRPAGADVRSMWDLDRRRPIVASISRFHPVKNLDLLVDATAGLGVTLVLAGDATTPYGRHLRARLEKEGRTDVALVGYVEGDAKAALLQQAEVFASASHVESYGLSIAEALAGGCAILCTEGAPWQEVVAAGAGLRVGATAPAMREALSKLLARGSHDRQVSRAVAARHDWGERGRSMLEHYQRLLAEP